MVPIEATTHPEQKMTNAELNAMSNEDLLKAVYSTYEFHDPIVTVLARRLTVAIINLETTKNRLHNLTEDYYNLECEVLDLKFNAANI